MSNQIRHNSFTSSSSSISKATTTFSQTPPQAPYSKEMSIWAQNPILSQTQAWFPMQSQIPRTKSLETWGDLPMACINYIVVNEYRGCSILVTPKQMESFQNPRVPTHSITDIAGHTWGPPVLKNCDRVQEMLKKPTPTWKGFLRSLCAEFRQPSCSPESIFDNNMHELITIFVNLGLFWHFETVTNIRTWIESHKYWRML